MVPGSNFINHEYVTSFNKNILFVCFYAEPSKRLTMRHLAAIKKSEKYLEDPQRYLGLRIVPEELSKKAAYLNALINQINFCIKALSNSGLKFDNKTKNRYILQGLKDKFPEVGEKELEEGYTLAKFMELLKGRINYENEYLEMFVRKLEDVPAFIKGEYLI